MLEPRGPASYPSAAGTKVTFGPGKAAVAEIQERLDRADAAPAATDGFTPVGEDGPPDGAPAAKAKPAKRAKGAKEPKPAKEKKPAKPWCASALDAAAQVPAKSAKPMRAVDMVAEMEAKGLWKSPSATPEATLYAAIIREISAEGKDSRFKKHDRGLFVAGKTA